MQRVKLTISAITKTGVHPQFYEYARTPEEADEKETKWRKLAAEAGTLIRIDKENQP